MSDLNKQQQQAAQQQMEQQQAQQQQQQQQQQAQQQQQQQVQQQQQQQPQTIQVQLTHDGSQQMHGQAQVVSSGTSMIPTSTMVMSAPQQTMLQQNMQTLQNMQNQTAIAPMPSHSGSTTITTMSSLGQQQQMADWGHGRVQVIQQPLQNQTYVQQVYNPQGQLLMPGNIALHSAGMNPGSIQVIAATKPFQSGQMQHMLTAQGKQLVQGQASSFPTGYTTIPTSGNNQTLVFSQLGVQHLLQQQPQQQQQQQQQQKQDVQKMMNKTNGTGNTLKVGNNQQQSVTIGNQQQTMSSQGGTILQPQIISPIQCAQQQRGIPQGATQAMQFAPWQPTFPQGLTWAPSTIQSPTLLATQGNQIFIRGPQPDQGMFHIHNAAPQNIPTHQSMQIQQIAKTPQQVEMQPKAAIPKTFSNILPNSVGPQQIRPASSVSTQTGQTQTTLQGNSQKAGNKVRTKTVVSRNMPSMATQKSDAANQTKGSMVNQNLQPKLNGGQTVAMQQQDKMMRVANAQHHMGAVQQMHHHQVLFQQQLQPKPVQNSVPTQMMMQGQVVTSQAGDNRPVMPVVSLPPGVQQSLMAPMVVQNIEQIPNYQQQNLQMLAASSVAMKMEENLKEDGQQMGSGPGRPDETSTPMDTDASTGGNEDLNSDSAHDSKTQAKDLEKSAPKAMVAVKPQVLTHVIEGFVIQESAEPFAVNRGGMEQLPRAQPVIVNEEPTKKKQKVELSPEKAKCEVCGKIDLRSKFKQSKRFCSLSCSKSARVGLYNEDGGPNKDGETGESAENPSSNGESPVCVDSPDETLPLSNPYKWTVNEVCDFIRGLPGGVEYAEDFAVQEIDGQALMLLKEDHLMSAMSIKLGPALKILSKIDAMRVEPPAPS